METIEIGTSWEWVAESDPIEIAAHIDRLREALKMTYSRVPDDKAQDLGFVEALLNQ